jgi:hypothetical protein
MKDFHDLDTLSRTYEFDGETLAEVIRATLGKRQTELSPMGERLAFTAEFYLEAQLRTQMCVAFTNADIFCRAAEHLALSRST